MYDKAVPGRRALRSSAHCDSEDIAESIGLLDLWSVTARDREKRPTEPGACFLRDSQPHESVPRPPDQRNWDIDRAQLSLRDPTAPDPPDELTIGRAYVLVGCLLQVIGLKGAPPIAPGEPRSCRISEYLAKEPFAVLGAWPSTELHQRNDHCDRGAEGAE